MNTPRDRHRQTPDGIELRHLRALVAVADELSFSRASRQLYLTQPTLSRQIRALEKLVGCELLRRNTRNVELTPAGEALLDSARQLLAGLDEALTAARALGGELNARMGRIWAPVQALYDSHADLDDIRSEYEKMCAQLPVPPEVETHPVNAAGVPGLMLTRRRPAARRFFTPTGVAWHSDRHTDTVPWPPRWHWPPTRQPSYPSTGSRPRTRTRQRSRIPSGLTSG